MLIGIETAFKTVVGDDEQDIEEALHQALGRVEAVIITGGIGPTEDDMTRKVVSKILKKRLVLNEDALKDIHARLSGRGREYLLVNDRQALIPAGARLLRNPIGTAPGFFIDEQGPFVAVLPGVPGELRSMYREGLRQALEDRSGGRRSTKRRILRTCGMGESAVNQAIQNILRRSIPAVGLTAKELGVDIRIVAHGASAEQAQMQVDRTEEAIREKLGDAIYGVDAQELEEVVGALLKQRKFTIAVAESCTGGLVGGRITNIAGSSEYFEGGIIAYSNPVKTSMLGVPKNLIDRHGAVSTEVAAAMAQGVRQALHADLGVAITGIAGPGGGTEKKPVGLVYTALASSQDVKTEEHRFLGERDEVRVKASQMALDMVRKYLIG